VFKQYVLGTIAWATSKPAKPEDFGIKAVKVHKRLKPVVQAVLASIHQKKWPKLKLPPPQH